MFELGRTGRTLRRRRDRAGIDGNGRDGGGPLLDRGHGHRLAAIGITAQRGRQRKSEDSRADAAGRRRREPTPPGLARGHRAILAERSIELRQRRSGRERPSSKLRYGPESAVRAPEYAPIRSHRNLIGHALLVRDREPGWLSPGCVKRPAAQFGCLGASVVAGAAGAAGFSAGAAAPVLTPRSWFSAAMSWVSLVASEGT